VAAFVKWSDTLERPIRIEHLFSMPPFAPDLMVILASSLDDPSIFKPGMDIYISSAQPWDHMNPALQKFPKMPPMG
jgi:hypothetical protein